MKPLIGITGELKEPREGGRPWGTHGLLENYHSAVFAADGLPVTLPLAEKGLCEPLLQRLDGLILSGGLPDIPGSVLGEHQHPASNPMPIRRWHSEQEWFETAARLGTPILSICLGMQLMHVLSGGKMIQDIPSQVENASDHTSTTYLHQHDIVIEPGSQLAQIAPALRTPITSAHHQGICDVQPPYRVAARSDDGIIEAQAQEILEEKYGVIADVWSVTSFSELRREALETERWNRLHPDQEARVPWVTQALAGIEGPVIASTDYMRIVSEQISAWVPGGVVALGTDGFGRSDNRAALRHFFEVDAKSIAGHALSELARRGSYDPKKAAEAIRDLGMEPDRPAPFTVD